VLLENNNQTIELKKGMKNTNPDNQIQPYVGSYKTVRNYLIQVYELNKKMTVLKAKLNWNKVQSHEIYERI
jgi:hypothetical protein